MHIVPVGYQDAVFFAPARLTPALTLAQLDMSFYQPVQPGQKFIGPGSTIEQPQVAMQAFVEIVDQSIPL
ncbi:MAG: hypothetical protein KME65_08830 [Candidatus Thiodiazotropha sp. (ex Ctena orbiculata)]|uniref:Uncharacterized protein n=1 Tax=Candidatus Thiodiazotropha taylori TaxID=2792791 RepID=A0A944QSN0_9GAMM|nr:hypothetical protein [Candidatus Thiodiazotropha taylori]MBV2137844.1 hypothetical protein [Candidatus Thiodiazotropha taylori]